jgi:hypothetical protein
MNPEFWNIFPAKFTRIPVGMIQSPIGKKIYDRFLFKYGLKNFD